MKNKIGWCNATWNPVWGCLNNCEYCYGRRIAKRFWKQMWAIEFHHSWEHPTWAWTGDHLLGLKDFKPTFLDAQFAKGLPKKSQRIFVGSMSEIYYWKDEWMEKVLEKIKQYPQHTFQFLTKFPRIYSKYIFPSNCWLGMTITREEDIDKDWGYFYNENNKCFFSIEPFLDSINPESLECIDWIIIGAETGNRKSKIMPKREWIEKIVNYCRKNNIPIYLKDSLKDIYPEKIKMFP
jgi:protein gp37